MSVKITVEHLGKNRFRFVSSDMSIDDAKRLDGLLSGNGYSLDRLTSTKKKVKEIPRASHERFRQFYKSGGVL